MALKGNRAAGLKSAHLSGIIVLVLLAIWNTLASCGELPAIKVAIDELLMSDRIPLATVGAGLRPALPHRQRRAGPGASNRVSKYPTIATSRPFVIPAKAGIQTRVHWAREVFASGLSVSPERLFAGGTSWIPAFAGMTSRESRSYPARSLFVLETLRPGSAKVPVALSFSAGGGGGYTRQDDPPQPRITSDEQPLAVPDTAAITHDSLPQAKPPLGPPSPGTRRRVRLPSLGGFFHSPTGTLLKSVAFPGWGQWSNGKKQKAAVYFGIETYFLTKALIWRHRALDRLSVWERTDRGNTAALQAAFSSYDSARNSRNYFYWLTGITAFISMFDAYADSYLLTLERTRKMGDDYWGGQARFAPDDEVRLAVAWRF